MIKFVNQKICCLITDILVHEKTSCKALSTSLDKTNKKFALKLYKDNNTIIFKIQIYFFSHNVTCFKYKVAITRKY